METKITVAPSDVWGYFYANKDKFGSDMYLIAESDDGLTGIYIAEQDGDPQFIVEDCNEVIDEDMAITKTSCEETARRLYSEYLGYDEYDMSKDAENEQGLIEEREDELSVMFENLLFDLLPHTSEDTLNEISEDVKEHTLEYIARKFGLPIYRPMYLTDENGEDFFSEYPYEEMVFEDYNPIYDND